MKITPNETYTKEEIAKAFPDVDCGFEPLGSRVIVQLRSPKETTKGGIILSDDSVETEMWNTQIGKVVKIGPLAFKNRETQNPWPEGDWAKIGDYVRIPKFNQDKWFIEYDTGEKTPIGMKINAKVLFMAINDLDLIAIKTGNPLEVKAYV